MFKHIIEQECFLCSKDLNKGNELVKGKLEIGRNEDDCLETTKLCPICIGKGWLIVRRNIYGIPHKRFDI